MLCLDFLLAYFSYCGDLGDSYLPHSIHSVQVYCTKKSKNSNVGFIVLICILIKMAMMSIEEKKILFSKSQCKRWKMGKRNKNRSVHVQLYSVKSRKPSLPPYLGPHKLLKSIHFSQNFCCTDFCIMTLISIRTSAKRDVDMS